MMAVLIDVRDRATPIVRAIGSAIAPTRLNPVVGRAVVNIFREHLFEQNRTRPNALGGTRTNFYAAAARGTHFDVVPDGVLISVNQVGIRQRVLGGTIVPKQSKFLTIPARAEAHGKRAGEFSDLYVVFGKGGVPVALARAISVSLTSKRTVATARALGTSKGIEHGGEIMFWLVKSVTQAPDPSVIPTESDIGAAIDEAVQSHVQRAVDRAREQSGGAN